MPSVLDYQIADFARTIASDGIDIVIAGVTVRALVGREKVEESQFAGVRFLLQDLFFVAGAFGPMPQVGVGISFGSEEWKVRLSASCPVVSHLVLERVVG